MKKISLFLLLATFSVATVFAQENATQQQLDQLRGKLQDIVDAQDAQTKRIDALAKKIDELADKVNTPAVNNSASADDLKRLTIIDVQPSFDGNGQTLSWMCSGIAAHKSRSRPRDRPSSDGDGESRGSRAWRWVLARNAASLCARERGNQRLARPASTLNL